MKSVIIQLLNDEEAQGLIEYSLLVSIIAIALVFAVQLLGDAVIFSLNDSKLKIVNAIK